MLGVFQNEQEYCAPHYADLETAKQLICTNTRISIPVYNDEDMLMLTLQIECEYNVGEQISPRKMSTRKPTDHSPVKSIRRQDTSSEVRL